MAGIDETRQFIPLRIAVLTVSDTRGPENDSSGDILVERIKAAGHKLAGRAIEIDDASRVARNPDVGSRLGLQLAQHIKG